MFSVYSNRTDHFEPGADGETAGAIVGMGKPAGSTDPHPERTGCARNAVQDQGRDQNNRWYGGGLGRPGKSGGATGNQAGGPTILFASDVLPLEYMNFTGKYKSALQKTGKLPADNYTLCTRPVRPADYAPLGEEQCKPFYLASLQLPILMKPYNEELLDPKKAQTAILFRWSPVVPAQTSPVTYRIQVFEVLNNQSPVQALRSNQPLLDKELLAVTQYIWQPQLTFVNEKSKFIWTIQSLDKDQKPINQTDGNGEGRSEPIVFFIGTSTKHD